MATAHSTTWTVCIKKGGKKSRVARGAAAWRPVAMRHIQKDSCEAFGRRPGRQSLYLWLVLCLKI